MNRDKNLHRYGLLTVATLLIVVGNYFFTFPNQFCFGGISGLSTIVARLAPISASTFNSVSSLLLLFAAFVFVGKQFAMTTAFVSIAISVVLIVFEKLFPLSGPLTDQSMLEFVLAVTLPAVGSAILFHLGASSGGTDILAMILKKYAHLQNIGVSLFWIDLVMVGFTVFVFDVQSILYSALGLTVKTFLIDDIIGSITMCKSVMVVCTDAEPICSFIMQTLDRGATVSLARGAYTGAERSIVFTTLNRRKANQLRVYIRQNSLQAFITMSNTIDVFGEGFTGV